jgi:hypothetical protein
MLKYRQDLPIISKMDASKAVLVILLATIPAEGLWSSDFYLARIGPAPLRFAAVLANSKAFVWPVPLIPSRSTTNSAAEPSFPASNTGTNLVIPAVGPTTAQTNSIPATSSPETNVFNAASPVQTSIGADGNPLSASNLLIVTPQMLADYFKATPGGLDKVSTNAPVGAEIPFNPPTPKPPSSEAVYRTQ